MSLLHLCTKYLCLEISDDMSKLAISTIDEPSTSLTINVNDVEEIIEFLEELANLAISVAQYVKETRYVKGFNKNFSMTH